MVAINVSAQALDGNVVCELTPRGGSSRLRLSLWDLKKWDLTTVCGPPLGFRV